MSLGNANIDIDITNKNTPDLSKVDQDKEKFISRKKQKTSVDIVSYVILITLSIIMIAPLVWMLSTALKVDQFNIYSNSLFDQLYFSNFITVFKTIPLLRGFINSLVVAVPSILVGTFVSGIAAYAFAKIKFKARNTLFLMMLIVTMIPFPVIMIPQYYIFSDLNWIGTLLPLIVPKMFGNIFMIFFLRQFLLGIPDELIESAKIDGAGHFRIFIIIIMPLLGPALAAQMIMWFMGVWNDYLAPMMFASETPTLPVVVASLISFTDTQTETHLHMAASIISMIPVLAAYAIFQKRIINSVILSGMK